jgi:8-oxo-dGTP pyrophosphatase MutT (NUDIX family)
VTPLTTDFLARLAEALARRAPATLDDELAQRAAVAVVVSREEAPAVLFVKRGQRSGDPWSGHVAFPGGFRSAQDDSSSATAIRETEEETGLSLATLGQRLGTLDDVYPRSVRLPRVIITPEVFAVAGRPPVYARAEVEKAVWVPVSEVFDPANRHPFVLHLPESRVTLVSIVVQDLTIWGLTERVLNQIANLL